MLAFPLQDLVRSVLTGLREDAWSLEETDTWCYVSPPDSHRRVQGWKLHVSSTPLSAPYVLHRAAEVLVANGCPFKFARSVGLIEEMTSSRYDRAQCGKIITAYPHDDEQVGQLAEALDTATAGLPGPAILSDRPYRKGGLVHYRYGAFRGVRVLTNDGAWETRLEAPDGGTVPDQRKPWFCPPEWAALPIEDPSGGAARVPAVPGPVLLDDRFEVREAIRHSARGGVYRALDRKTGEQVIVKQARAHVAAGLTGDDARVLLRREARALAALSGICPELVHQFEQDGHAFLVEGLVPGRPLTDWVQERCQEAADGTGVDPGEAVALAGELAGLLAEVHRRGLVYQDFTPGNVMVTPQGRPLLIDPEWARPPGEWTVRAMTPGFAAPEQADGPRYGPAHGPEADLFSLGAVLGYVATGVAPAFAEDEPRARTHSERIRGLMAALAQDRPAARLLAPAVLGLTREEPAARWTVERLGEFLADVAGSAGGASGSAGRAEAGDGGTAVADGGPAATGAGAPAPSGTGTAEGAARAGRLVDDGLAYLLRTLPGPGEEPERLWAAGAFGDRTDPCAVQYGSAGVLAVLVRADRLLGREDLRAGVERVAAWTDARRTDVPQVLPGLHFGRSGTAWALHDAARHLGDTALADRAADLALSAPVRWPNPDVCHGAAGAGLAQLYFWHATGRTEFLRRVDSCADGLADAVERTPQGVLWPVPDDFDSGLAGLRHLGFAHGVAGIGAFLLYAGLATGRQDCLDLARAAGDTLVAEAERGPWGARWRADARDEPGAGLLYHWCSGSSGVGTFLVRLWRATGGESYLRLAEEAATAVHRVRWTSPTAACHGIAGNGDFLLDLAESVPQGPYRAWAEDLAAVLYERHADHDGLLLVPDEAGSAVRADYQTGIGGPLDFLLRLRHGGPRLWMPDAAVARSGREHVGPPGPTATTEAPHDERRTP